MDGELLPLDCLRGMGTGDLPFVTRGHVSAAAACFPAVPSLPHGHPTGSYFPSPILMAARNGGSLSHWLGNSKDLPSPVVARSDAPLGCWGNCLCTIRSMDLRSMDLYFGKTGLSFAFVPFGKCYTK